MFSQTPTVKRAQKKHTKKHFATLQGTSLHLSPRTLLSVVYGQARALHPIFIVFAYITLASLSGNTGAPSKQDKTAAKADQDTKNATHPTTASNHRRNRHNTIVVGGTCFAGISS